MENLKIKRQMKRAMALGRLIGTLIYWIDVPHRLTVKRNLGLAFPDWSPEKNRRVSKRVFQNLGSTLVEICQLVRYSKSDVLARLQVVGAERLQQALDNNRGLICVSAHLGNWEFGLQYAACFLQVPVLGVAKKISFKPLDQWMYNLRTRFGSNIIDKKGALPDMRRALRRREIVALLVDQSRRKESVDVNFFGHRVPTTPAAAFLSIRCKSPVLPICCVRDAFGQLTFHVEEPLNLKRSGDLRADVQANTQLITDTVERMIRRYPDQWFWVHKRWKKYYPQLYPEYHVGRKRRQKKKGFPTQV